MNKKQLVSEVTRLYDIYEVDNTQIKAFTEEQIVKGIKGILATLDREKRYSYSKEDLEIIKDIYFYYA